MGGVEPPHEVSGGGVADIDQDDSDVSARYRLTGLGHRMCVQDGDSEWLEGSDQCRDLSIQGAHDPHRGRPHLAAGSGPLVGTLDFQEPRRSYLRDPPVRASYTPSI